MAKASLEANVIHLLAAFSILTHERYVFHLLNPRVAFCTAKLALWFSELVSFRECINFARSPKVWGKYVFLRSGSDKMTVTQVWTCQLQFWGRSQEHFLLLMDFGFVTSVMTQCVSPLPSSFYFVCDVQYRFTIPANSEHAVTWFVVRFHPLCLWSVYIS